MEQIIALFPERIAYAISNTVLHSLWQITLISLTYLTVIRFKKISSSRFKYNAALIALFFSLLSTISSFLYFYISSAGQFNTEQVTAFTTVAFSTQLIETGTFSLESFLIKYQSSIAALWLCGTILLLVKFMTGILNIFHLKQSAIPTSDKRLNYLTNTISAKLNISRIIQVKESALISTPIVIGHIKPIILFPVAVSTQLSMNEIEAILAHELAHILRNDFIVNLLQSLTEVLLYFHPCIWWLSSIIRAERENCCDDIALNHVEDNLSYAKSLVKLQELQLQAVPSFALAFSGSKHQLKNRIMRILNQSNPSNFLREKLIAIALLFTFVLSFANNTNPQTVSIEEEDNCALEDVLAKEEFSNFNYSIVLEDDTIPEKNALIIKKKNKSESLDVKMEDGKIVELRVDGELIPEDRYDEFSDRIDIDKSGIKSPHFDLKIDNGRSFSSGSIIISDGDKLIHLDDAIDIDSFLRHNKDMEDAFAKAKSFSYSFPQNFGFEVDSILSLKSKSFEDAFAQLEQIEEFEFPELFDDMRIDSIIHGAFPFTMNEHDIQTYKFNRPRGFERNNYGQFPFSHSNNLKSKIARELADDDFLTKGENTVELSGKHMKINGEKQARNIWNKYKRIYEKYVGADLNKDSKIVLEIEYDGKPKGLMRSI